MKMYHVWFDSERICPYMGFYEFNSVEGVKDFITRAGAGYFYLDIENRAGSIELLNWLLDENYHEKADYLFSFNQHGRFDCRADVEALINKYWRN